MPFKAEEKKAELVCVPPAMVAEVWPHARPLIRAAIVRTGLSRFENIEADILGGRLLLWLIWNGDVIEAAGSTEIDRDACVIIACGGSNHRNWMHLVEGIERYARQANCRLVRIIGRRGWKRVLRDYSARFLIMERDL